MPGICEFKIKINKLDIDKKINLFIKTVKSICLNEIAIDKSLEDIKNRVLDSTESYIDAHRRRPSSPNKIGKKLIEVLRETSSIEKTDNGYRLGIGNEKVLYEQVPYWEIINYGGIPWGGKAFFGLFEDGRPKPGGKGHAWIEGARDENGVAMMKPKNPIPPMHYLNYMSQQFERELSRFKVRKKR